MTQNHHTPYTGVVIINDGTGANFNRVPGELDQAITDMQDGLLTQTKLSIGSGGTPQASAVVQMDSTSRGWALPQLTTAQRDAITAPPRGLMIFNSTDSQVNFYDGSLWLALDDPAEFEVLDSGSFSGVATTTISSIAQTHQHLRLRLTIAPDSNDAGEVFNMNFNGDSTSGNYSYNQNYNATIAHAFTASAGVIRYMNQKSGSAANVRAEYLFDIMSYTDTNIPTGVHFKGCFCLSGAETVFYMRGGFSWHKQPFEAVSSIAFGSPAVNTSGAWKLYGVQ